MGVPDIEVLPLPAGEGVVACLPRLARALTGSAPVLPYAAGTAAPHLPAPLTPPELPIDLAAVVGTSGSTGTPKRALLSATALRASARATTARLFGPTPLDRPVQWLLALPPHHIAGLQVLLRSLLAGTTPVVVDHSGGFTVRAFLAAANRLDEGAVAVTSLVPTQLIRLLDDPRGHDALHRFSAILVGGAAMPPALRQRAKTAGLPIRTTYGMSETAGGCVYDGLPLPGCEVDIDADGRVLLAGPMLAHGYLGRPDLTQEAFGVDTDGTPWFRTDDLGERDEHGILHVRGRVDDLITTGGLKVSPRLVEDAVLARVAGVRDVVVVATPDPQWGHVVSVALVLTPPATPSSLTLTGLRAALRGAIPDHALPRRLRVLTTIPTVGPGKPDRRHLQSLFAMGD